MGYVPAPPPDFGRATATLYAIASIADVGNQFLAQSGRRRYDGLPRTFEEYVARLYGNRSRDWTMVLNYGFLAALIAAVVVVIWMVAS